MDFSYEPMDPELDLGSWQGGEQAALRRLEEYMAGPIESYSETKNNMLNWDSSSKLSPWLANGCLSPRCIFEALRKREQLMASASCYWLTFGLLVRDFFHFMARKHGNLIFTKGIVARTPRWTGGDHEFQLWSEGITGYPLVDANMLELRCSGWMSNRGRQNVASFLIHDLQAS